MGFFYKGKCYYCNKKIWRFFEYKELKDEILCNTCYKKFLEKGLLNEFDNFKLITLKTLRERNHKSEMDITTFPIIEYSPIALKENEQLYYCGDAYAYHEKNIITQYKRTGANAGFRVAKGIYIGKTQGVTTPIRENIIERYPGKFYITTYRFILIADKYGFELKMDNITSIKLYKDALEFFANGKTYTVINNEISYIRKLLEYAKNYKKE